MAGANSIFYGEKLLTTGNPDTAHDRRLFERLNIVAEPASDAQGAALVGAVPLEQPAEYRSAPA
jgi:biotin synthase